MNVQKINSTYNKKSPAFKSIGLYKDYSGLEFIQVWNSLEREDGKIFIDGEHYFSLTSKAAKEATEMLRKFGEKITENEHMQKLREILTKAVGVDIIPALEEARPLPLGKTFNLKNVLGGDVAIANYKTVIQNGIPKYYAKGSVSKDSHEVLSIGLNPDEMINFPLTRGEIAKLGKLQP